MVAPTITMPTNTISIHALREEGDIERRLQGLEEKPFQSTPSARRATRATATPARAGTNFNPRPPRGGRQQKRRKNPPRLFHYTHLCTI